MADLPSWPARLLGLRAGLLGRRALSAPGTAQALGITSAHEGRLERRALVELRAAASNGCDAGGSTLASAATGPTLVNAFPAGGASPGASSPPPAGVPVTGAAVIGASGSTHSSAGARGRAVTRSAGSGAPSSTRRAPVTTERAGTPAGTPSWALFVALAALALAGAFALLRAYHGPGRTAAVALDPTVATSPAIQPEPARASAAAISTAPSPTPAPAPTPTPVAAPPRPASAPQVRRWGRHEAELAAVAITAIAGGAVRLVSRTRKRSTRRR